MWYILKISIVVGPQTWVIRLVSVNEIPNHLLKIVEAIIGGFGSEWDRSITETSLVNCDIQACLAKHIIKNLRNEVPWTDTGVSKCKCDI